MANEFNSKWIVTTLLSYRRTIIGTLQSFRIMVAMVNIAVKSLRHIPIVGALFPFFSLTYFISAVTEWGLFFKAGYKLVKLWLSPDPKLSSTEKQAAVDKIYAALSAAVSSTLWGIANLCMILFFVSMPAIAVSMFMGACVYELVKGVYDFHRVYSNSTSEKIKSRAVKDLIEGLGVNLTFIVSCTIFVAVAAFVAVNPILIAAAASAIVVALTVDLAWRIYKWRKDKKEKGEEELLREEVTSSSQPGSRAEIGNEASVEPQIYSAPVIRAEDSESPTNNQESKDVRDNGEMKREINQRVAALAANSSANEVKGVEQNQRSSLSPDVAPILAPSSLTNAPTTRQSQEDTSEQLSSSSFAPASEPLKTQIPKSPRSSLAAQLSFWVSAVKEKGEEKNVVEGSASTCSTDRGSLSSSDSPARTSPHSFVSPSEASSPSITRVGSAPALNQ